MTPVDSADERVAEDDSGSDGDGPVSSDRVLGPDSDSKRNDPSDTAPAESRECDTSSPANLADSEYDLDSADVTPTVRDMEAFVAGLSTLPATSREVFYFRIFVHPETTTKRFRILIHSLEQSLNLYGCVPVRGRMDDGETRLGFDLVTEPTGAIDTISEALDDLTYVSQVHSTVVPTGHERGHEDKDGSTEPGFGSRAGGVDAYSSPSQELFDELREKFDRVEFPELVTDPEYIDLLDSFGGLSVPEDELSLDEILSGAHPESSDTEDIAERREPGDSDSETGDADRAPLWNVDEPSGVAGSVDVVDRLCRELESDSVTEDQRARLREAIGGDESATTDVRIRHLQSRYQDVEAYVDVIEEFIDEWGTARTLLDVQDDQRLLREEVADLKGETDDTVDRVDTLASEVEKFESRQEATVAELSAELEALVDSLADVTSHLRDVTADVETNTEWRTKIQTVFEGD